MVPDCPEPSRAGQLVANKATLVEWGHLRKGSDSQAAHVVGTGEAEELSESVP